VGVCLSRVSKSIENYATALQSMGDSKLPTNCKAFERMFNAPTLATLAIEDLKHLKTGKQKNRGKQFRKAMAPWTYCQVIEVVTQKCQENNACCQVSNG
jgi:hypothetical protein